MNLERESELEESEHLLSQYSLKELERRNVAITKLKINSVSTGVYGRILLHLSRLDDDKEILRRFSPGDIVGVF